MNYDRIILELLGRVSILEDEVKKLKEDSKNKTYGNSELNSQSTKSIGKDGTKFILDGKIYSKNRLVLAVVKKYMEMHPDTTAEQLLSIFDKSLQGSFGTVRILNEVKRKYPDYTRRFFTNDADIITTKTESCTVCSQWSISNIWNFIARSEQLGIEVKTVK